MRIRLAVAALIASRSALALSAIRAADADVVGIQEPEGNLGRIAASAEPGKVVAIVDSHLTCCPYEPNLARPAVAV